MTQPSEGDRPYDERGLYGRDVPPLTPPSSTSPSSGPVRRPPRKVRTGLIVGIVALVFVLLAAGYIVIAGNPPPDTVTRWGFDPPTSTPTIRAGGGGAPGRSIPTPSGTSSAGSSRTTQTPRTSCPSSLAETDVYATTVPAGWCLTKAEGAELWVSDSYGDMLLAVPSLLKPDPVAICTTEAAKGTSPGQVTRLADTSWGGRTAVTAHVPTGMSGSQVRCVLTAQGYVFTMGLHLPGTGTYEYTTAAMDYLTSHWTWK